MLTSSSNTNNSQASRSNNNKSTKNSVNNTDVADLEVPTASKFARLRYGNNIEIIFNINCQVISNKSLFLIFEKKKTVKLKLSGRPKMRHIFS
jgi:hypothetical protein